MVYTRRKFSRARRIRRVAKRAAKRKYKRFAYRRAKKNYSRVSPYDGALTLRTPTPTFGADVLKVHFKWVGSYMFTWPATGAMSLLGNTIKANSIYDPWGGVVGWMNQQTGGASWYTTMYSRYKVLGAKLTVTMRTPENYQAPVENDPLPIPSAVFLPSLKWGIRLDNDNTIDTQHGWEQFAMDSRTKMRTYNPRMLSGQTIIQKYSLKKEFGAQMDHSVLEAATGADPSGLVYMVPWMQVLDQSTPAIVSIAGCLEYKLEQFVEFSRRKDLTTTMVQHD